ncbi:hypothetical protein [Amycolatopsis decaplanina]|uniref:Excreted virulence factor EspC, type VII ESX diderm n=1 Tax=Amycolatopsis decaplanina DSM 44594 TaxID=1284240 RepID=M2Z395_9PSEU|nr:hypothetical protein [Amycolatopsis decaplanina]EME61722.1 hypothetical protein H074_11135 [Amycolatopsis decaplanina DSM 44594]
MSGGFTAATDALSSASKNIGKLTEQLLEDNPDLSSTPVNAAGFGQAHGDHAKKYTDGVAALWASVQGYSSTLGSFGTNLATAGTAYGTNEDEQKNKITKTGMR